MDFLVYGVALLLLVSVVLLIKAALFDHRPQKIGMIYTVLAVPLYLVYYSDRWPFGELPMRDLASPLDDMVGANVHFQSDPAPAAIIGAILLVHMTVLQRVAVRRRLQRILYPIATFFAGAVLATLIGGTLVSTFAWGWPGAVIIGAAFALVYLGALALLGAVIELTIELSKLFLVWLKRKIFTVATWITRMSSWISSLGGRLVSRALIERIRADTVQQESIFQEEQDTQDSRLYEAYLRDRARRRRSRGQEISLETTGDPGPIPPFPPGVLPAQPDAVAQDGYHHVSDSAVLPAQPSSGDPAERA